MVGQLFEVILSTWKELIDGMLKLDWKRSCVGVKNGKRWRDPCFEYYQEGLYIFKKVADTDMYYTKVYYIGDILWESKLETVFDLFKFCNKVMYTKERFRVKTPGFIKMIKLFKCYQVK